ncbi:MAG: hypothetical protein R2852_02980 [Bacteroidia bacterium]
MKSTVYKFIIVLILNLVWMCSTFSQTILKDGKEAKLYSGNQKKIEVLVDSLVGKWELIETICIEDGDTISQVPSEAPQGLTTAKPPTTIFLDSLQKFKVLQCYFKGPLIEWAGHYKIEIRTLNGVEVFYLKFIENRDAELKNRDKSFTADFNGCIIDFKNGLLKLKDDKNFVWVYRRKFG